MDRRQIGGGNRMKKRNRSGPWQGMFFCLMFVLLMGHTLAVGAEEGTEESVSVTPQLNAASIVMIQGKSYRLKVSDAEASTKIKWSSGSKKVATVSSTGKVKAKAAGKTKITAKVGNVKLKCKVTVGGDRWSQLLDQYRDDAKTNQLVFVRYTGGSSAKVQMYTKSGKQWKCIVDCGGYVGSNGIGKTKEGDRKTPTGTFNLTQAFGIKDDPGAGTSYVKVNQYLYWCGDQPYYNQLVDIREHPHSCRGEHLIDYVPHYYYGMFLDYNKDCVYGKGSAIFLHCTGSNPYTGGCIAVSQENMIKIIQNAKSGAKICIYPA